jgi:hypothetical protein
MERTEYLRMFPSYCKKCEGWGILKNSESSLSECDACFASGTCPRCATENAVGSGVCDECLWDIDDEERGLPGSNMA